MVNMNIAFYFEDSLHLGGYKLGGGGGDNYPENNPNAYLPWFKNQKHEDQVNLYLNGY